MVLIHKNFSLKSLNTFKIDVKTKYFTEFKSVKQLKQIINHELFTIDSFLILGEGSNILFTKKFEGIILKNNIKGIDIISEDSKYLSVKVGAGEIWHDFVLWSVNKNLSGIENLALIPGLVGGAPIQNIGAYGCEVKDTITEVEYLDIYKKEIVVLKNKDCKFSYRESIFKKDLKNNIIITNVTFRLSKKHLNIISYGTVEDEIKKMKTVANPKSISKAVIKIRNRKLPRPSILPNAGSFFKNPIVSLKKLNKLKKQFPDIVHFPLTKEKFKIAAGWMIETIGYKGYKKNNVGVHKNQALVLVNYGKADGIDIFLLSKEIQKKIKEKFDINIETEVNIL
tara:strand:- start:14 stop:1030 length:1017 start_codon:yes stop_codon:yes gene_type:complete